ncbi:unnamed protein product [Gongylonema pulchrum]|uniref:Three-Cys-motif partner protein TcmP n=1 Tax=Gongylonema pulchrum TaxID=637853 RepID=A0A183DPM8_9BILA|nr:unnamed protein product [Gongylonema pulchrum]
MEVYCRRLDLEDFNSVRDFVLKLDTGKGDIAQIDGIVYSAATVESERHTNEQHIERTIATNHLGPFLLTSLLYDRLRKQSRPVRLVFLNTSDFKMEKINFEDLNSTDLTKWRKSPEKAKKDAYYQSKLALALFVKSLSEKVKGWFSGTNIQVIMVDPGLTKTNLFYRLEGADGRFVVVRWCKNLKRWVYGLVAAQSTSDATRPVLFALADEKMENANGTFIDSIRTRMPWHQQSDDADVLEQLWLTSAKWTETGAQLQRLQQDLKNPRRKEGSVIQDVKPTSGLFTWLR